MAIQRMDHVGVVVDDLVGAIEFFEALGLEVDGQVMELGDERVDRILALDGVRTKVAFLRTPDGHGALEVIEYQSPKHAAAGERLPANVPGLRHVTFAVDDLEAVKERLSGQGGEMVGEVVNYDDSYLLAYVYGPSGVIVELAQKLGG
jgi:catechol 2,3-dioxygenase-like lactoylglutathione lyase family enzyme